mmetsp:Transcript_45647/g.130275  ORF Transcript_45647/g.130275 Transcript_45647/m.130275 type:complete len:601 (+) Transcript_45647:182-1984(+)
MHACTQGRRLGGGRGSHHQLARCPSRPGTAGLHAPCGAGRETPGGAAPHASLHALVRARLPVCGPRGGSCRGRRRRAMLVANGLEPPGRVPRRGPVDPAIRVLGDDLIRQLPDGLQDACRMSRVCVVQMAGAGPEPTFIKGPDQAHAFLLQPGLHSTDILHGKAVLDLGNVEHVTVCPVGAAAAQPVRVHIRIWGGHQRGPRREWHEDRAGRGVRPVPEHGALAGAPSLHHMRGGGAEETDASLPVAPDLPAARPAVRVAPGPGGKTPRHVVGRALVVGAVHREEVLEAHALAGPGRRRVHGLVTEVRVVVREHDPELAVGAPNAAAAVELVRILTIAVDCREVQRCARFPPALLQCHSLHGLAVEEGMGVVEVNAADHKHVGNDTNVVVWDPLGRPDGALARRIGEDVEDEGFVGIPDHEALGRTLEAARTVEAVLLRKGSHQLHGLARGCRALERDAGQRVHAEQRLAAVSPRRRAEDPGAGRLADAHAMLVDQTVGRLEIRERVLHLRNETDRLVRGLALARLVARATAVADKPWKHLHIKVDGPLVSRQVVACRDRAQAGIAVVLAIVRMRHEDRAILRGRLADHECGARTCTGMQ